MTPRGERAATGSCIWHTPILKIESEFVSCGSPGGNRASHLRFCTIPFLLVQRIVSPAVI
jgi:hypothetical protein